MGGYIKTLESLTNAAVIKSHDSGPSEVVVIGSKVTVVNEKSGRETYIIGGSIEINPTQVRFPMSPQLVKPYLEKKDW